MNLIELKCKCGGSINLEDNLQTYINPDGRPDDKGRIFVIEVAANSWLDRHQNCMDLVSPAMEDTK